MPKKSGAVAAVSPHTIIHRREHGAGRDVLEASEFGPGGFNASLCQSGALGPLAGAYATNVVTGTAGRFEVITTETDYPPTGYAVYCWRVKVVQYVPQWADQVGGEQPATRCPSRRAPLQHW